MAGAASIPQRMVTAWVAVSLAAAPALPVFAHHNGGVSTVAPSSSPDGVVTTWRDHQNAPWFAVQLSHRFARFSDLARGDGRKTTVETPEIDVQTTTLQASVMLAGRVSLDLSLPWTLISSDFEGTQSSQSGVGDLRFGVRYRLGPLSRGDSASNLPELSLGLGVTLPTGSRSEHAPGAVKVLQEDGLGVRLLDLEMRTNIGTGVAWLRGLVGVTWPVHPRVEVDLDAHLAAPLASASDGTEWGAIFDAPLTVRVELIPQRLGLRTGLNFHYRAKEQHPFVADGVPEAATTQSVTRWSALAAVEVRLIESLVLHGDISVPFHHDVADVQLVQSFAVGVGLAWAFSPSAPD